MTVQLEVDGLTFTFPNGWQASKYDDWSYYRNQFIRMWQGIKSVDVLAVDPQKTAWLIEVKDYRRNPRTKPSELADEVARKVFDTLAALVPAKTRSNDAAEQGLAVAACASAQLRVVLHLEQPAKSSKLFPRAIDPADIQQKMRRLLKPIDAHPLVVETGRMRSLSWSVS
ncbi:MAG: hypothetical protein H7338_19040 [Candidatus Sericytochromatia bacterium]|nr:hypothetical protein [Candidatus Sericytochromatia bacterium]